jgi:hypothetical protein
MSHTQSVIHVHLPMAREKLETFHVGRHVNPDLSNAQDVDN